MSVIALFFLLFCEITNLLLIETLFLPVYPSHNEFSHDDLDYVMHDIQISDNISPMNIVTFTRDVHFILSFVTLNERFVRNNHQK
jgi:hypothetical protein